MTYVGNQPRFTNSPVYSGTGNGASAFDLGFTPGSVNACLVFLSGVQQRPTTDYTVSGSTITFTTAPPTGVPITVVGLALAGTQGALALPTWQIKTTTYNPAINGDYLMCNTTSAGFTVTLPATPSTQWQVVIADYAGTFATNNLTVARNGSLINGAASDWVCDINNETRTFVYVDATQGWRVL